MVLGQIQKFPAYGIVFYGHATLEVMRMIGAFVVGAIGYPLLELIYRKRTHYSMAVAGGIGLCLMKAAASMPCMMIIKVTLCGLGITIIELLCGMIWNRQYQVWDYRKIRLNYKGQVCLPYTLLWCALSACVLTFMTK